MAVNQPIITGNQADDSWKLEVTQQINNEEVRVNALASQVGGFRTRDGSGGSTTIISTGNLVQNDYLIRITSGTNTTYQFTMVGGNIPETHMLFLGGFRLCESTTTTQRDYSISGNTVTLTRGSTDFTGLDLVLTIFTLA